MGQRIGYGALAIIVLATAFAMDVVIAKAAESWGGAWGDLLERGSLVPLLFLLASSGGALELRRLLLATGARPFSIFAHLMIAALVLAPWLSAAGWLGSGPAEVEGLHWQLVLLLVAGVGVGVLAVLRRNPADIFRDVGATFTLIFYLGFLPSFGLQLRCGRDIPGQEGAWLLLIAVLVTKASDIGAFFVGSACGRHKLMPAVSPGKTIEGAIGGLMASGLVALAFSSASSLCALLTPGHPLGVLLADLTGTFGGKHHSDGLSPAWRAVLFGFALSAAGQFGDLLESCFKRDADTKDSGKLLPRFGGILDLVDSPVLAIPVAWFLLIVVWEIV